VTALVKTEVSPPGEAGVIVWVYEMTVTGTGTGADGAGADGAGADGAGTGGAGADTMLVTSGVGTDSVRVWPGAVAVGVLAAGGGETLGQRVIVVGTAVIMPGFSGMLAAQIPVK
jgi:hypothetical protein